jgi:hypothetical protein
MDIMERNHGAIGVDVLECINPMKGRWVLRYDIKPTDNNGEVSYISQVIEYKPTIKKVKDIILSWMNSEIDNKIVSGFMWNGMKVWLSSENQFNYKAAYDLAVQTGGANLPVVFKLGTTEEPVYYEFKTVDELSSFYMGAMNYINETLNEGWREKDKVDWTPYEDLLK